MKTVIIYTLSDPRDGLIKYVGKTFRLERRFRDHLQDKSKTKKTSWIKNLKKDNLVPIIEELEVSDEINCDNVEKYWIEQLTAWGFVLKNTTKGGDGSFGVKPWNKGVTGVFKHSDESKKLMSDWGKSNTSGEKNGFFKKTHSDELKKKWSKERKGSKWNEKQIKKLGGDKHPSRKPVFCYDINNNFIKEYNAAIDAKIDGFDPNMISKVCRGLHKTHKNYIFKFYGKY